MLKVHTLNHGGEKREGKEIISIKQNKTKNPHQNSTYEESTATKYFPLLSIPYEESALISAAFFPRLHWNSLD